MSERFVPPEARGMEVRGEDQDAAIDLNRAIDTIDTLNDRAQRLPERSKGRRFFTHAALLVGLLGAAFAPREGAASEPEGAWGVGASEQSAVLDERLEYLRERERDLLKEIERLQEKRSPELHKKELKQKTKELGRIQSEIERKEERLDEVSDKWTQKRAEQSKTIDISERANDATDALLAEWKIQVDGDTILVPLGDGSYQPFRAGSQFIDVGFIRDGNTLHIIFERTDHTYHTVRATFDRKLNTAVYAGEGETNDMGKPLK